MHDGGSGGGCERCRNKKNNDLKYECENKRTKNVQ